jgi:hypothetical protein
VNGTSNREDEVVEPGLVGTYTIGGEVGGSSVTDDEDGCRAKAGAEVELT